MKKKVFTVFIVPIVTIGGFISAALKQQRNPSHALFPLPNSPRSGMKLSMIWYEIEYFSFLIIAVLFSAGNAKKNVFTVFIDPIVTIDVLDIPN